MSFRSDFIVRIFHDWYNYLKIVRIFHDWYNESPPSTPSQHSGCPTMMSRSNSPFDQIGLDSAIANAVTTSKVAISIVVTKQIRMPMRVAMKIMLKIFLHALTDFSFLSSLFFFSFLSSLMDFLTTVGSLRDLFHQRIVNCLEEPWLI